MQALSELCWCGYFGQGIFGSGRVYLGRAAAASHAAQLVRVFRAASRAHRLSIWVFWYIESGLWYFSASLASQCDELETRRARRESQTQEPGLAIRAGLAFRAGLAERAGLALRAGLAYRAGLALRAGAGDPGGDWRGWGLAIRAGTGDRAGWRCGRAGGAAGLPWRDKKLERYRAGDKELER